MFTVVISGLGGRLSISSLSFARSLARAIALGSLPSLRIRCLWMAPKIHRPNRVKRMRAKVDMTMGSLPSREKVATWVVEAGGADMEKIDIQEGL